MSSSGHLKIAHALSCPKLHDPLYQYLGRGDCTLTGLELSKFQEKDHVDNFCAAFPTFQTLQHVNVGISFEESDSIGRFAQFPGFREHWKKVYAAPMKFRLLSALYSNTTLQGSFVIMEFLMTSGLDKTDITDEDLDFVRNVLARNNGDTDAALTTALQDRLRTLNTGNWHLPFEQESEDDT